MKCKICLLVTFLSFLYDSALYSQALIIRTQAGNDTGGFTYSAPLALRARITQSAGVAVDFKGNLYFTNDSMNIVQKVTPNGNLTVYAGNMTRGFSGDFGLATAAQLFSPIGLACDAIGNLYIADNGNSAIRKVDTFGIIKTIAGVGGVFGWGFSGDGHHADSAHINGGSNIAFDKYGNMYIADGSTRVRKVDTLGIIRTVVGGGGTGYAGDGGPATAASFGNLAGVAVDTAGNIYVSDVYYHTIRKVKTNDTIYAFAGIGSTAGGFTGDNGVATAAKLNSPVTIVTDLKGNVYVADRGNNRIRIISPTDTIKTYAGSGTAGYSGEGGVPTSAAMKGPNAVCLNALGNLFISDASNYVIRQVMPPDSIKITSNYGNIRDTICAGTPVTFTAIVKNAGYGDTLRWFKNSTQIAGNTSVMTTNTFNNNDTIKCILYAPGGGTTTLTSNKIYMTVRPSPSPIIGSLSVCLGTTETLIDTTSAGIWASRLPTIATVSSTGILNSINLGIDTVTYTIANGCKATSIITINPYPSPIYGANSVCNGFTIALLDSSLYGVWTTSNSLIASISDSGIVNGNMTGSVIITYNLPTGCKTTSSFTVNPIPAPIGGTTVICSGTSTTLYDIDLGGAWSTSDSSIATISAFGVLTGQSSGTLTITYTLPTSCATTTIGTIKFSPNPIDGIITGITSICIGTSIILNDSTYGGTWSSSNSSIVSINDTGKIVGVMIDTAIVSYTIGDGCMANLRIIVDSMPAPITGSSYVCVGATISLSNIAIEGTWKVTNSLATFIDTTIGNLTGIAPGVDTVVFKITTGCSITTVITVNPLPSNIIGIDSACAQIPVALIDTTPGGLWSSINTSIAMVSSSGIVTGLNTGIVGIAYTIPTGCKSIFPFTVKNSPLPISGSTFVCLGSTATINDSVTGGVWHCSNANLSIDSLSGIMLGSILGIDTITYKLPSSCSITTTIAINANPVGITGVSAVCLNATTTLIDISLSGSWASSDVGVATISSVGIVTGISANNVTITYTLPNGCYVIKPFTVNPLPSTIFGPDTICTGIATGLYNLVTDGIWNLSNHTIATIDSIGTFTGIFTGIDTVKYILPLTGCKTTKAIALLTSPAAITCFNNLCLAQVTNLSDSITGGTWSCSNTAIISIIGTSTVIGEMIDTATLFYTLPNGCLVSKPVTVYPLPMAIIGADSVCAGISITLNDSTFGGIWNSKTPSIATIDTNGIFTAIVAGLDTIIYKIPSSGCITAKTITIKSNPSNILGESEICEGGTSQLVDTSIGGNWSISNSGVATISSTGLLTGYIADTAMVAYVLPTGCMAKVIIIVDTTPKAINGIISVCNGFNTTLSDSTLGGTWASVANSIAIVNSDGIVTGVNPGFDTIVYTISHGCFAKTLLSVLLTPAQIVGINTVCMGSTITLTDSSAGGNWISGNTSLAIISGDGIVTGVMTGIDTIIYKMLNGCSTNTLISIEPMPYVPVISLKPEANVCMNTMFRNFGTNTPIAGVNYNWSASNAEIWAQGATHQYCLVNFIDSGTAVISLHTSFDGYTCQNTSSYMVNVSNSISDSVGVIYAGNNFICTRSDEDSYQWGYDNIDTLNPTIITGQTVQNYYNPTPDFTNHLYWVITTLAGCLQKSYYVNPAGINQINGVGSDILTVYPNPVYGGSFTVEMPELHDYATIIITDIIGKTIATNQYSNISSNKISFKLNNVPKGIYLIRVETNNKTYHSKIDVR